MKSIMPDLARMKLYKLYLEDDIPAFGCGLRIIEVLKVGRKWVKLRSGGCNKRIRVSLWEKLKPYLESV